MKYEQGLKRIEGRIEQLFGEPDTYNLHALPIETLEAMKSWLAVQLDYLGEEKTRRFEAVNNAKAALKIHLNERKIVHLKDLTGSDKARIATMYAENDAKDIIKGVTHLENEYEEIKNKEKSAETLRMSIVQTISTTNKAIERRQFIGNGN